MMYTACAQLRFAPCWQLRVVNSVLGTSCWKSPEGVYNYSIGTDKLITTNKN